MPGWGIFVSYLVARYNQTQADLVDQLFNSAEKRLARTLLLLARFGKEGRLENIIPKISQATLSEMVGTTRARINFLKNRFRRLALSFYYDGWAGSSQFSTQRKAKSCCTSNVSLQDESGRRGCAQLDSSWIH